MQQKNKMNSADTQSEFDLLKKVFPEKKDDLSENQNFKFSSFKIIKKNFKILKNIFLKKLKVLKSSSPEF